VAGVLVVSLGFTVQAAESTKPTPGIDARTAWAQLASLAGAWEGTAGDGTGRVEYRVASGGTVVMETLFPGTPHEMISMYHVDGDELVMTHYCAMGNQPKMALTKASTANQLVFDFVGGTNIKPKKDTHMHSGRIQFEGKDAVTGEWDTYVQGEKAGSHKFFLARKA